MTPATPVLRRTLIILRPTVSGIDEASAERLLDGIRAATGGDIHLAYLDVASPSLHEELDRAEADQIDEALLVPIAIPRDKYLLTWTRRGVANWQETRPHAHLDVRIREPADLEATIATHLATEADDPGQPVTVSPASYRSPAWSVIEPHDRHVLICKGPRCMAYGAGPVHRALTAAAKGTSTKTTGTGCLSPCNLGPLAITYPEGTWYGHLTPHDAHPLAHGTVVDSNRALNW